MHNILIKLCNEKACFDIARRKLSYFPGESIINVFKEKTEMGEYWKLDVG